jgi:hypothetical protein
MSLNAKGSTKEKHSKFQIMLWAMLSAIILESNNIYVPLTPKILQEIGGISLAIANYPREF